MGKREVGNPPQQKAMGNIKAGEGKKNGDKTAESLRELHESAIDKHALGKAKGVMCVLPETFGKRGGKRGNSRPCSAIE